MLNEEKSDTMICAGECRRSFTNYGMVIAQMKGHPGARSGNFPKGTVIVSGKSMSGYGIKTEQER